MVVELKTMSLYFSIFTSFVVFPEEEGPDNIILKGVFSVRSYASMVTELLGWVSAGQEIEVLVVFPILSWQPSLVF